ncbi:MAG: NAD(P)/FAD-dependent oxidoreductase [Candidatus Eiseniibacteriota bacterium]
MRIGIVGGGIFGLSAALELARRHHSVTVFDRAEPPAPDAASHDHTKALRFEYGAACPLYVPLVDEARSRYRALERGWSQPLYVETGVIALAGSFDESRHEWLSYNYLIEHGWPVELWTVDQARARFPQFSYKGIEAVTWNPQGGYLRAAEAVRATARALREAGGTIVASARVAAVDESAKHAAIALGGGERFEFDTVIVATGAWFRALLPQHAGEVSPTRQFVTYYRAPAGEEARFTPPAFPVWMHDLVTSGWYGMPLEGGLLKVAHHEPGDPADPDAARRVDPEDRKSSRDFVRTHLPGIDPDWYAEDRGCLYAMTYDGNFLIDRVPGHARTFVAGGGSGHGMKLGPAVGRLAADLVEGGEAPAAFRFDAVRSGRVA